jgi:hypothetical protein
MTRVVLVAGLALWTGCAGCPPVEETTGGASSSSSTSSSSSGGASSRAGSSSGGARDAGVLDAGRADAGRVDAGPVDAGNPLDNWPYTMTGTLDPATGSDVPGPQATATCQVPQPVDPTLLNVAGATTHRFTGTAPGITQTGMFYVYAGDGREIVGPLETDASGAYTVSVPLFCGYNLVKLVWDGNGCRSLVVHRVYSAACTKMDLRLTILWDETGRDWELHLIKPGGQINNNLSDCTWTSCINSSPDWGVPGDPTDDPKKDVDDLTGFGPESIYLPSLEMGNYTVMVEHWNTSGSITSDGQAIINLGGASYVIPVMDLAPMHVWTVGTINGNVFTPGGAIHDCSANWSLGCRDVLP